MKTDGQFTYKPCFLFSSQKNFYYLSHRIFGYMHEVLNAVEKITNYTVNARDEIRNGNFQFENRFRDFIDF